MAYTPAAMNAATNAITAAYPFIGLHSADPGTTGANETTATRKSAGWPAASAGRSTVTALAFTGGTGNGACTYVGFWSAATGGTFGGGFALSGNQTFDASGNYTVDSLTATGTAS